MMLKTINPLFKPLRATERLATSTCSQEVTDTAANLDDFQNKTPCADCFVLLNDLRQVIKYGCTCIVFFSPAPGRKNKDWKGVGCYGEIFVMNCHV